MALEINENDDFLTFLTSPHNDPGSALRSQNAKEIDDLSTSWSTFLMNYARIGLSLKLPYNTAKLHGYLSIYYTFQSSGQPKIRVVTS